MTQEKLNERTVQEQFSFVLNSIEVCFEVEAQFWLEFNPIDHEFGREDEYEINNSEIKWIYDPIYTEEECYYIEQYFHEKQDMIHLALYNNYLKLLPFIK
jgi:hypothetical protein